MSYTQDFSRHAGRNSSTPQDLMNSVLRSCTEGAIVSGDADLHAAQYLNRVVEGVNAHLNGAIAGSPFEGDDQLRVMAVVELASIRAALDSSCPVVQTKTLRDIMDHGSVSSAELSRKRQSDVQVGYAPTAAL